MKLPERLQSGVKPSQLRGWLNQLRDALAASQVRGDGKTVRVNDGPQGKTLSMVPKPGTTTKDVRYAVSATYDSGTDTVTVTCPSVKVFWADSGNAYRLITIPAANFDVVMNGETSLGVYANCERGATANTGVYTWYCRRAGAATSAQLQMNRQMVLALMSVSTGVVLYSYRAESIDGQFFGNQKSSYEYSYTEGTRSLGIAGYQVNQSTVPVGLSVVLPASTVGKVYIVWDYGGAAALDTTTAGHSQYRLVADFVTVGDALVEFDDRLGAMLPGLHPIGVSQVVTINDDNGTVHTLTFSAGVLVAYSNV